jgi:hypothetical protein
LPVASVVNLRIFDALGREVAVLVKNEALNAGNYAYDFDASALTRHLLTGYRRGFY